MNDKHILLAMLLGITFVAASCEARPEEADLARVKEHFLAARFQSLFVKDLQGKSDLEIFQFSCAQNRVQCDQVLDLLKEKDPTFYDTLKGAKPEKK